MLRIVCFHLYNDYSGSPKVFSQVIEGLLQKGYKVDLYTSNTEGFLSNIEGVDYHLYSYKPIGLKEMWGNATPTAITNIKAVRPTSVSRFFIHFNRIIKVFRRLFYLPYRMALN